MNIYDAMYVYVLINDILYDIYIYIYDINYNSDMDLQVLRMPCIQPKRLS